MNFISFRRKKSSFRVNKGKKITGKIWKERQYLRLGGASLSGEGSRSIFQTKSFNIITMKY